MNGLYLGGRKPAPPSLSSAFTFSKPARSFNVSFIPSVTRPCYVEYSINIDCDSTITETGGTTEDGRVNLVDIGTGLTIATIRNYSQFSGTVLIGVAIVNRQQITMTLGAWVLPNTTLQLQTAALAGTPTFTMTQTAEWVF